MPDQYKFQMAIHDFQAAQQKAGIQEVLARFTGKSAQLLSYDDVAEKLKLRIRVERGLQNIPLEAIVGSVGRYTDFTRTFLPRRMGDQERWARVKTAMESGEILPPIEVYKVGDVYFVVDGNHRVSIARQEKFKTIEARVIEFNTDVKLTSDIQPDDLIVKSEYIDFMRTTNIGNLRPNVDLTVTAPGQYEKMLSEICEQELLLERQQKRLIEFDEAVGTWYDQVYIPLAEHIRDRGLLQGFPERTITDLYIWISENRSAIEEELGWEIQSNAAATDLILDGTERSAPGSWRKARTITRYTERLFMDILVPLSGDAESWDSLEQAIIIAQHDDANIRGLHIVDSQAKVKSEAALAVQAKFNQLCIDAGVKGNLVIEAGEITKKISERARATDLIVLKIVHPPMGGLSSLRSPFRSIIANSSRPVLGVPQKARPFKHALIAYDGSELAKEALFVATYLAEVWKTQLSVFTMVDGKTVSSNVHEYVHRYLEFHEVDAEYLLVEGEAKEHLIETAKEKDIDIILMGSHGGSVLEQVLVGSMLDFMLRESTVPVFIGR